MNKNICSLFRKKVTIFSLIVVMLLPVISAHAAAVLEVEPITWNVIGLDSNLVTSGPNHFPVGVRICNTGDAVATNVDATFVWDSANALINLRPGTLSVIDTDADGNPLSIAAGACFDAYFEVEITRNASAYDTTRSYHVSVTADVGITASSPTPREIYVEHLISQSRNSVNDLKLDGVSIPPGGIMELMVGNTYDITVDASTATQGYNQLEAFVSMPNTIFQVLAVNTTYSANSSPLVDNPNDQLYADACGWENDPNSPNYLSCVEGDGKAGGDIETTYTVKILSVPGAPLVNPEPLTTLIHDFSGSSFHYNSDYDVTARYAMIYDASSVTIDKSFVPKAIDPNGTSIMEITITNPTPIAITGINFSDDFPAGMSVDGTPGVTYSGFGAGAFSPALSGGETSISFSGGTLAAKSTGKITVNVTADTTAASYANTTNHLYINTSEDTGNTGSDTLYISSAPPAPSTCVSKVPIAAWTMPTSGQGSGGPPPPYSFATAFAFATAAYSAGGGTGTATQSIVASTAPGTTNGWQIGWNSTNNTPDVSPAPDINTTTIVAPYIDLTVQYPPNEYGGIAINFSVYLNNTGWASPVNNLYIYSKDDGGAFGAGTIVGVGKNGWTTVSAVTATTSGITSTTFRIFVYGMTANKDSTWLLDDITIAGCKAVDPPDPPTITKSFLSDPIAEGGTSTLRFTITNPNISDPLSGVTFIDTLPAGLDVATASPVYCGGTLQVTDNDPDPDTIELTGATLAASGTCTFDVTVTGTTAGDYTNVSGNISATESGTNTDVDGYATDTITVTAPVVPPTFLKYFSPSSIYTFGTSTLTFSITNPNTGTDLTGVGFTDSLPSGLVVATPNGLTGGCGSGTITATAGSGTISLAGATLLAGDTCTFSVTVEGTSAGTKTNSAYVTSNEGGNSAISSASLVVADQTASIDLNKEISAGGSSGPWTKYTSVPSGGNVWYRFKVYNSGELPFTDLAITDDQFTPVFSWGTLLPLAPGDEAYRVYGPVTADQTSLVNTAHVDGTYAFGTVSSANSSAEYASAELTLTKSAAETYYTAAGDVLHYSYVVENTGASTLSGPVSLFDDLSSDETCPALSTIGDGDNFLDPGESITCTATYTVVSGDVGTGKSVTNNAYATLEDIDSNTDSATVPYKYLDLTVTKANDTGGGTTVGSPFIWTLTISNSGEVGATFTDTQVIVSDPLPAGATYVFGTADNFTNVTNSGNISCAIDGSNVLTCTASGASVTIGAGGSFTVSLTATPTATGTLANTATVDPDDNVDEAYETNNTGSNTVIVSTQQPPLISWDLDNSGGGLDDGGFETTFGQGGAAQAVGDVDASVVDADDTAMATLTLVAGDIADGANEIFTIGGVPFPQNADKTATKVTVGGIDFDIVYVTSTGTFTITNNKNNHDMPIADINTLLRGILYQNTLATPTYGNRTLSATTNDGTADSNTAVARILVAKSPTLAVIGDFGAYSDGGKVAVHWQTVSENNTMGFYLYRLNETTGKYKELNHKLLPGLINAPAGGLYSYEDNGAKIGTNYTYLLEEVEISGKRITYGPWEVTAGTTVPEGNTVLALETNGGITGFSKAANPLPDKIVSRMAAKMSSRLNAMAAKLARKGDQAKISIAEDGIYFINAQDIAEVLNIDQKHVSNQIKNNRIRLRCMGQSVAVLPAADNSGIYFYGEKHDTRYSDENVYWLDIGNGLDMNEVSRAPQTAPEDSQYFDQSVLAEKDQYPMTGLFSDPDADFWMWDYVFPGFGRDQVTLPISSPGAMDVVDNATLTVSLQGGSDVAEGDDHHAIIYLNGTEVGSAQWDGLSPAVVSASVPAAILNDSENQVKIAGTRVDGVPYDIFYVNDMQLVYPRKYTAFENQLTAENNRYKTIRMDGFTDPDIWVFDITNPQRPLVLTKTVVAPMADGSGDFQISFKGGSYWGGNVLRRYLAETPDMIKSCTLIADRPSSLKTRYNRADYVIISSSDMVAAAQSLADYRSSRGHVSKVVDIEDIYDEFSYGIRDPEAIRTFLAYAYKNWQISPKYVLLAGDGSFDYKDNQGFGDSVIPAMMASTPDGLYVTDFLYSDVAGDDWVPDLSVGRVPVISADELTDYIDKVKGYEAADGAWTGIATLAADSPDDGGDFIVSSEEVAGLFPSDYLLDKLYLDAVPMAGARTDFVAGINEGRAYVNFIGHGSMFQLGNHNLFSTADISKLTNGTMLPVVTAMTCVAGDFGYPGFDGLNEDLVLKSSGGAAAVWAPSGYTYNQDSTELCKGFYSAVFIGGEKVLGDAVRRSQESFAAKGEELYHLDLYNLVGDPALKLK